MKKIVRLYLLIVCTVPFLNVCAQTTGAYRSATSGDWSTPATWQIFNGTSFVAATITPSSSDGIITIRNGHTITISNAITADQIEIGRASCRERVLMPV